jgi:phosphatidylglycerophosphate synthase
VTDTSNRRPLRSRDAGWAKSLARGLARAGVSPDVISFMSIVFALIGACGLLASSQIFGDWRILMLVIAAAAIQLRLLCNLLDGMVAVEHGKAGPLGPIWNELPDRFSDVVLLVGAGLAASPTGFSRALTLGWTCALLAVLTAYVRELGRALGLPADFSGPMAKAQRMAVLTLAALAATTETYWHGRGWSLFIALAVVAALTALTLARRVRTLARALEQRAHENLSAGRAAPADRR